MDGLLGQITTPTKLLKIFNQNKIKMILQKEEIEKIFHNALCDGCHYLGGYGLSGPEVDNEPYKLAKEKLRKEGKDTYLEDVWMQALKDGAKLTIFDEEGDGENTSSITIQDVYDRVPECRKKELMNIHMEEYDAEDADVLIQYVFFQDIVFG